jgi:DNA-binding NarL/FixJ family response regulator
MIRANADKPGLLLILIVVQTFCAAYFLWDVLEDALPVGLSAFAEPYILFEAIAVFSLILAVLFETRYLMALLRHTAHLERQVSLAAGAFHEIMQEHFRLWKLTAAEQDVAGFTVKGMSISEIASLRGSAEGTVKSHLSGIYRKAGVTGRGALLSLLIDDLIETPLVPVDEDSVQHQA